MGSYVIRIYRAQNVTPPALVGMVVDVGSEESHPFHRSDQLWQILAELEMKARHEDVTAQCGPVPLASRESLLP